MIVCLFNSNGKVEAGIWYEADRIVMQKNLILMYGRFINDGEESLTVQKVKFTINVRDRVDYPIWNGEITSPDIDLYVPAGSQRGWSFSFSNFDSPAYNGEIKFNVYSHVWYY